MLAWSSADNGRKGIAIHPEIVYSALRRTDSTIVIIAQGRVPELREQLGTSEEVMTFKGVIAHSGFSSAMI